MEVSVVANKLRELSENENKQNLEGIIAVWEVIQEMFVDTLIYLEKKRKSMYNEFQILEESNNLLRDFVDQKSKFSPTKELEIHVTQILKKVPEQFKEIITKETHVAVKRLSIVKEKEQQPLLVVEQSPIQVAMDQDIQWEDKGIQTERDIFDKRDIDQMDKSSGPDREIPVYRSVAVFADLRHPAQDQNDQLKSEIQSIQGQV